MHNVAARERKAATMVAVLKDHFDQPLSDLHALDVGASTGIIDHYLSNHFKSVFGLDIDREAINNAIKNHSRENLQFRNGDAMDLDLADCSFDIVICSQVYEHVPDAQRMMAEIHRVLRPGGICYFAASNRLMWNEPHYNLPLLSVVPRPVAHHYIRLAGKADFYHELHLSYWGLRKLVSRFRIVDYTRALVENPDKFGVTYMLSPGSFKNSMAKVFGRYFPWAMPGYIWLLEK